MKEENILDDFPDLKTNRKSHLKEIILTAIAGVFLLVFIEVARTYLPEYLFTWHNINFNVAGLLFLAIISLMAILITKILDRYKPKINKQLVVLYTGLLIFCSEFLFKLIQYTFLLHNGFELNYFHIIPIAVITGFFGMIIANIAIHRIRKRRALLPILLLIGVWLLISFLIKSSYPF